MAETLISPGVLARENDQSQLTSQPVQAGAATSTGFTVPALSGNSFAYGINGNGYKFVYYAHA